MKKLKKYKTQILLVSLGIGIGLIIGAILASTFRINQSLTINSPISEYSSEISNQPKPLEKYTIENLAKRTSSQSKITLEYEEDTFPQYGIWRFSFITNNKKATGLAHLPKTINPDRKFPVIIQLRGYVDPEIYQPGIGTQRSSAIYAKNGFITLAPDFLGFGDSDDPAVDVFEERFERYTTILDLISSIPTLPQADTQKIGLWGHSNGGQIALTVLEITGGSYPTSLWAPVSKPFPFSILYYTDEFEDYGKALRKNLASFEKNYDADLYSLTPYLDKIQAPITLHQGDSDIEVPQAWSDDLSMELKKLDKTVFYYTYPGADHNLSTGWNTVVARDVEFFKSNL